MTVILLSFPKSTPILAEQNKRLPKHIYLPDDVYSLSKAHNPPTQSSFRQLASPTDPYHLMNSHSQQIFYQQPDGCCSFGLQAQKRNLSQLK